jgi:NADH-quinone oxidoreductase subunit N
MMAALGLVPGRLLAQVAPTSTGAATLPKLVTPHVEYHLLAPQLVLVGSAVVLLGSTSVTRRRWPRGVYAAWTAISGLVAIGLAWHLWGQVVGHSAPKVAPGTINPATGAPVATGAHAMTAVAHAVAVDGFSLFLVITLCAALVLGALLAESYLPREGLDGPEFYVLAMLATAGAAIMASANDLIVVFLGLEILSISLYVLTGYHRNRDESGEAAIKYFVLGAFSSAFFLYGIALVYGATGSTGLGGIASYLATTHLASNGVLLAGIGLMIVGLGFKVSAVPFHVWTPDVYQGAPTPVTGFMAAAAKAAGFAALLRVFLSALPTQVSNWQPLVGAMAALTVVVGAVLAIVQTDVKRMLAYSSISHAGFVLIGLVAAGGQLATAQGGTPAGLAAALFYLATYTFMVIGTFAVITVVSGQGDADHSLEAYRGLAQRRPMLAVAFTVLLMAQAGVPFTSGFFAKFYVISAVVALGTPWTYALAAGAMLSAVAATFFYLRIIVTTWSAPLGQAGDIEAALVGVTGDGAVAVRTDTRLQIPPTVTAVLITCVGVTIALGLAPGLLVHFATRATLIF